MVSNSTTLSSIVTKSSNLELDGMEEVGYLCLANGDTVGRMEFDSPLSNFIVIYIANIPGIALKEVGLIHHVRLYKVLVHF